MDRSLYAKPDQIIGINSAETLTIDCTPSLGSGETLDDVSGSDGYGNTLGASVSDGDLDFEAPVVNTGTITSARTGATIAVGKAVQIRVIGAGCKPGKTYTLKIVMTTSSGDTMPVFQDVIVLP
mgnify:FL=1